MNWWDLVVVLVLVCVMSAAISYRKDWIWVGLSAITSGVLVIIIITICVVSVITVPKEITLFSNQKQYIESHITADPVENAAITTKKIELNEWLFNAQYSNDHWGGWSFYPDSVQDIEPIE